MRGERPFLFTNLKEGKGVPEVADFIARLGGLGTCLNNVQLPS
jgi:urease accessory protein